MRRWQRLGVSQGDASGGYDVLVGNTKRHLADYKGYPDYPREWDHEAVISGLVDSYNIAAILGHLEYTDLFGDDVTGYAERAVEIAVDFFYGDWRDGYQYLSDNGYRRLTPGQCRKKLDWIETYREGLMCALCLDLEEPLERLTTWPDTDLPFDDGAFRLTEEDNKYHIVLARYLRDEPLFKNGRLAGAIRAAKRRRPRLLLETLETIDAQDESAFATKFTQWMNTFRRTEFKPQQVWLVFSIEGTILWHVARRRGLDLPELPLELADLIITQETIARKK